MTGKAETAKYRLRGSVILPPDIAVEDREGALAPGDEVTLPVAYGDHLVAERLAFRELDDDLRDAEAKRVEADGEGHNLSDDDLRDAVADILAETGEEEGGDGVPNMDVVRAALVKSGAVSAAEAKKRVTVELRDAVWAELQG